MTDKIISDFPVKSIVNDSDLLLLETASGEYKSTTALAIKNYVLGLNPEVILLLSMDSDFDDVAGNVVTPVNSPTIDTVNFQFGGGSGLFNGTNQYIQADYIADELSPIENWTIRGWIRLTDTASSHAIFSFNKSSGDNRLLLFFRSGSSNGGLRLISSDASEDDSVGTITNGTFYHFAVSQQGNIVRAFLGGTLQASVTSAAINSSDSFSIGQEFDGNSPSDFFKGNLEDIQVVKNFAVTENFPVPTSAYTLEV